MLVKMQFNVLQRHLKKKKKITTSLFFSSLIMCFGKKMGIKFVLGSTSKKIDKWFTSNRLEQILSLTQAVHSALQTRWRLLISPHYAPCNL